MSEVDENGQALFTATRVHEPHHLSSGREGHVLVTDCYNHYILLLSSEPRLEPFLLTGTLKSSCIVQHNCKFTSHLYVVCSSIDLMHKITRCLTINILLQSYLLFIEN